MEKVVQADAVGESLIRKHMGMLVGKVLSYIDITIEDPKDAKDQHPKKNTFKRLFEKDLYDLRNRLVESSGVGIDEAFASLMEQFISYSVAAIPEKLQQKTFAKLVADAMDTTLANIKRDLGGR